MGHAAESGLRGRGKVDRARREREELAEAQARLEVDAQIPRLSLPSAADEVSASLAGQGAASGVPLEGAPALPGVSQPLSPTPEPPPPDLAAHYAALGVPADANLADVERAYQRQKKRWDPERFAGDSEKQARARGKAAHVEEAYQALREALTRERRL